MDMNRRMNKKDIAAYLKKISSLNEPISIYEEESFDFNREMHLIDQRYQAENALLSAISIGNLDAVANALYAYNALMQSPLQKSFPTSTDSNRDFKNSVHTMNTLFRKAIENNQVHPIYIHEYSSRFGYQIEKAETVDELVTLISEMVKKYCYLAKNYSLAMYSVTVKNAILYLNINLCAPLSTKDIAAHLNISPNYLSTQFKTETGLTITDYIRTRRIEMAVKLLNTTELSVQDIASQVGIDDASYFSKQFKQQIGMSPLEYQKMLRKK
jgi:AraC-like DNA-binding protein